MVPAANGLLCGIWIFPQRFLLKRLGFFTLGIVVGLSLAGVAYQTVALIGVTISGAETVSDLHAGWFPIKALVAYRVARITAGRVYELGFRK